jgi:hypothetical protein
LNRYSYCRNNPINYVDPTGLSWWSKFWDWITGGIGAIIAAVAIIVVTAVANVFTGGALTPVLMGEIFGAIGGAAGAAATGGDIGRGMLIGTVVGGVTGGILGPGSAPAGAGSGSGGGAAAGGGFIQAGVGETATWSLSAASASATEVASAVAMPAWTSVIASGVVGGGSAVINGMTSTAYAAENNGSKSISDGNSGKASNNLGVEQQNIKTGWWPKWLDNFVPGYGNYGGPSRSGPGLPTNLLDAAYEKHDAWYSRGELYQGDTSLVVDLKNLPIDPRKWGGSTNFMYAVYGAIHRGGAYTLFSIRADMYKNRVK